MNNLTAVSLFAGVGGFDLALERNGVTVTAAVEIDNNARGVLKHRFPNTTLFTDVCEVTGEQLIATGFVPERGIITGGFPCQDLSVAGKRAGLDGARSGLFWEICRLLDETKTQYFILENVPGLLSSNNGRDMGAVIGALVDRGYGVAYRVLDAQFFGVPQRRRRVVIVGSLGDNGSTSSEILALSESVRGDFAPRKQTRKEAAGEVTDGSGTSGVYGQAGFGTYSSGVKTLNASMVKRPEDSVVVNDAFVKSRRAQSVDDHETWTAGGVAPTLNAFDNNNESRATVIAVTNDSNPQVSVDVTNTLKVGSGLDIPSAPAILIEGHRVGDVRLTEEVSPTVKARWGTGGGNVPAVAIPIQDGREIEKKQNGLGVGDEGDPSYTLDQTGGQAVNVVMPTILAGLSQLTGTTQDAYVNKVEEVTSTVRRLTPMECERLQGFPDNWTAERYDYKKQEVVPQADSARYKQMGNAVAVPVFEWVISRLVAFENQT